MPLAIAGYTYEYIEGLMKIYQRKYRDNPLIIKGPATRNDFVNDIVDDARADAIFATLKPSSTMDRRRYRRRYRYVWQGL